MNTTSQPAHLKRNAESGASLIFALAIMLVMGLVVATLASYAITNHRATVAYRTVRDKRYAGQSGINHMVRWVQERPAVGRDPQLPITHPDCVSQLPAVIDRQEDIITVSCDAEPGSRSGEPADTGLTPPEGLVLLGARHNEVGPYNSPPCTGWWNTVVGFFNDLVTNNAIRDEQPGRDIVTESSLRFGTRTAIGPLNAVCQSRNRGAPSVFEVSEDIVAAGRVDVGGGFLLSAPGAQVRARAGCSPAELCTTNVGTRPASGWNPGEEYLANTPRDSDPARLTVPPEQNPQGNIADAWLSVPFKPDGSLRDGTTLPTRTTTFRFNPATGTVTTFSPRTCTSASATVVFLPGWYRDLSLLNAFTTHPSCADKTLWFAPDPGPDGLLLTADDRTGAFVFDFGSQANTARNCNGLGTSSSRWCIGGSLTSATGSAGQNPRIVVGTPEGWTPRGAASGSDPPPLRLTINRSAAIDTDLSRTWFDTGRTNRIDNQFATYRQDGCVNIPFIGRRCFAADRSIKLGNFQPKVVSPPIEASDAPNGRIFMRVRYGVRNATTVEPAEVIVESTAPDSPKRNCGTYQLHTDRTQADAGSGATPVLNDYVFTPSQAKQLADACGQVSVINGFEVTLRVCQPASSSIFGRCGTATTQADWFLDGVEMYYDTFSSASFPEPVNDDSTSPDFDPAAGSDCNPSKPGGQFVFNGDSNMYVADGSVEICAGPYPGAANLDRKQSIGIWAMPAVREVNPVAVQHANQYARVEPGGNVGPAIRAIDCAKTAGVDGQCTNSGQSVRIRYLGCIAQGGCDGSLIPPRLVRDAPIDVTMDSYTAPPGYKIKRVTARFAYNARGNCSTTIQAITDELLCGVPRFQIGTCSPRERTLPTNGHIQVANQPKVLAYQAGGRNCIGVNSDRTSFNQTNFRYHARCGFGCLGGNYDEFDGVAYQVELESEDPNVPRAIPQAGCITAFPNFAYGSGSPDCAVAKVDTASVSDGSDLSFDERQDGTSTGVLSVKGTIYAPSSAIELDDTDVAYPLATRGAVLRHLRISGFRWRPGYEAPAIDNTVRRTPSKRDVVITSCIQSEERRATGAKCDASIDQVLTRARVLYDIDETSTLPEEQRARKPQIVALNTLI